MSSTPTAEFVTLGSGAGDGPLAVRLAAAGHSVLVLEAGELTSGLVHGVPALHAFASESEEMSASTPSPINETQAARDDKYDAARGGVLYPRASTIGGCTAHNAMITVYPNDADWDAVADLTGDQSWAASSMRRYFERLERCTYRRRWVATLLAPLGRLFAVFDLRGHGFDGWLPTSIANPALVIEDRKLIKVVKSAAEIELSRLLGEPLKAWQRLSRRWFDPNIAAAQKKGSRWGLWLIRWPSVPPAGTARASPCSRWRHRLTRICGYCLVAWRLSSCSMSKTAAPVSNSSTARTCTGRSERHRGIARPSSIAVATREVIVAGGASNTPQLLKLSGIGPADELRALGIEVRVDSPGVGANLQDRYEVTVVTDLLEDLDLFKGGPFRPPRTDDAKPDTLLAEWRKGKGPYSTNGALLAVIASSTPATQIPDLFLFALPADFRG